MYVTSATYSAARLNRANALLMWK